MRYLNVPGYTNSGPGHWQTLWEQSDPRLSRVQQSSWDHPERSAWVASLAECVTAGGPVFLIANSLGCATVAHWAAVHDASLIRGALLVAPADVDVSGFLPDVIGFSPMPLARLPFPSVLVASDDDPFVSLARARHFAACWGSRFISVGPRGHLNTASGIGDWSEGRQIMADFVRGLS